MEQQNKKKMESEMPVLCANNCGFFGNSSTNNLCSKCYKEDSFSTKSKTPIESIPSPEFTKISSKIEKEEKSEEIITTTVTSSSSASFGESKEAKNRCNFCNKKVGLMGFKCKCGELFCSIHRYSDKHLCEFDYRGQGKEAITKANPLVKRDKVEKI